MNFKRIQINFEEIMMNFERIYLYFFKVQINFDGIQMNRDIIQMNFEKIEMKKSSRKMICSKCILSERKEQKIIVCSLLISLFVLKNRNRKYVSNGKVFRTYGKDAVTII
jgi:hypothetical protein